MKRASDTADISKSQIRKSLAFVINYDLSFELKPISGFWLLESENPGAVEMTQQVRTPMFSQWIKFNSYDPCSLRGLSSISSTLVLPVDQVHVLSQEAEFNSQDTGLTSHNCL